MTIPMTIPMIERVIAIALILAAFIGGYYIGVIIISRYYAYKLNRFFEWHLGYCRQKNIHRKRMFEINQSLMRYMLKKDFNQ